MILYFEKISFTRLMLALLTKECMLRKCKRIYFFDTFFLFGRLLVPLLNVFNIKIERIDFKMMDIRDNKGELVRFRIANSDLFDFQERIVNSEAYREIYDNSWKQDNILNYLNKGLVGGGIPNKLSVSRALFILEVVYWHSKVKLNKTPFVILSNRPWFEIYQDMYKKYNMTIISVNNDFVEYFIERIRYFVTCHREVYYFFQKIRLKCFGLAEDIKDKLESHIYIEGRGDINLLNNGNNSDFFVCFDSKLSNRDIVYSHLNEDEKRYLQKNEIITPHLCETLTGRYKRNYIKPRANYTIKYSLEYRAIKTILSVYDYERSNWQSFFQKNNIKVFFSWYKYGNSHIAKTDAIHDNGGVSVIWQLAFDGLRFLECNTTSDIVFSYSNFSYNLERQIGSNVKYNIISGYPKDYLFKVVREKANKIRNKFKKNGVKKIVFVVDEYATNDNRWHTGPELQMENYSHILKEVLKTPWLGVVFKPKVASDLRERLGQEVSVLLSKAEKCGRCFIYQESGRYTTSATPALAALSADVCIHGHLSSGTVALESTLAGVPTLLIDREGCPGSKFYDIDSNNTIFSNWTDAITATMQYFFSPEKIPEFGDWSSIIDELDPFRDGLAAKRMGDYLYWLLKGFDNGLKSDVVIENAANNYIKLWGKGKIMSNHTIN